jgi:membrane protease YdiL (CAAX protease family)
LIGLVVLTRRLGLANRAAMGYGLPRREFMRQLAIGWLAGFMLMVPLVGLLLGLDVRVLKADFAQNLPGLIAGGILSGLAVALIEETFFRGVLFTALSSGDRYAVPLMVFACRESEGTAVKDHERDGTTQSDFEQSRTRPANAAAGRPGFAAAVLAPSLLYAFLHFLGGKLRIPNDEVSWFHGFTVLGRLFERYADPLAFIDSFLALTMLGILLALVRWRTGAIAACIGLHAAGVCVIAVVRASTTLEETLFSAIVGSYDGVIGWAALAWFTLIALAVGLIRPRAAASWRLPADT